LKTLTGRQTLAVKVPHWPWADISHRTPQLVLCSPAKRARDTWNIVSKELKTIPAFQIESDIYDLGYGTALTELLHLKGGKVPSLMLVGHDPSIAEKHLRELLDNKYPKISHRDTRHHPF
jgi:phosphohistidine phosphatase